MLNSGKLVYINLQSWINTFSIMLLYTENKYVSLSIKYVDDLYQIHSNLNPYRFC